MIQIDICLALVHLFQKPNSLDSHVETINRMMCGAIFREPTHHNSKYRLAESISFQQGQWWAINDLEPTGRAKSNPNWMAGYVYEIEQAKGVVRR